MEIHHHAHPQDVGLDPSPGSGPRGKKKWTHYFWEFLMLFLAVFCGFLAENQREHMIEHKREKKYARTLYEDLKVDTALLAATIQERNFIIPKIDSFRLLVHSKEIDEIPAGTWTYYGRFPTRNTAISLQDATLHQLLSSGALRLFRKQHVANAIAQYDQASRNMKDAFYFLSLQHGELVKARNIIFDSWYMDEIMDLNVGAEVVDSFKKKSFPLLSNNKKDFMLYANLCQIRAFDLKNVVERIQGAQTKAVQLLNLLKTEYHLD